MWKSDAQKQLEATNELSERLDALIENTTTPEPKPVVSSKERRTAALGALMSKPKGDTMLDGLTSHFASR